MFVATAKCGALERARVSVRASGAHPYGTGTGSGVPVAFVPAAQTTPPTFE